MRLLKTGPYLPGQERLELIEKYGDQIPPYAILSHCWQDDEVLFADIERGTAHQRKAYAKLSAAFEQARKDGYGYLWIDTCCIDKTSSSELSEAINSMYVWYEQSQKCYALLEDVSYGDSNDNSFKSHFVKSRWFTRGWTLQELLAPGDLEFFSVDWVPLGNRGQLQSLISAATKIDAEYLTGYRPVQQASVAARMSWAAFRQTTRGEDLAYSLIGLFGVNMPMLYGEGQRRAFIRLQEEIMRNSDDQSIFAWVDADIAPSEVDGTGRELERQHGLLADSPRAFADSGTTVPYATVDEEYTYEMSNRGLSISLHKHMPRASEDKDLWVAALECHHQLHPSQYLGIYLRRLPTRGNQFARVSCHKMVTGPAKARGVSDRIYVKQHGFETSPLQRHRYFQLASNAGVTAGKYVVSDALFPHYARPHRQQPPEMSQARAWMPHEFPTVFAISSQDHALSAMLRFRRTISDRQLELVVLLGSITEFQVGCCAYEAVGPDPSIDYLRKRYAHSVTPISDPWLLENHTVQVRVVNAYVQADHKVYTIDIDLTSLSERTETEMLAEELQDVLGDSRLQRFGKMSALLRRSAR